MDLISGGHVTLSGNLGHHTRYSGRKHLCDCLYLRERGERVGHRLGLAIVSSAEECDRYSVNVSQSEFMTWVLF